MIYIFGEWSLDTDRYELHCCQALIYLEPQVFKVLVFLIKNRDRILSKRELISNLWPKQHISESALERCIMGARKALGDDGDKQQIIKTFYRRGYRFVAPVSESQSDLANAPGSTASPSTPPIGAFGHMETDMSSGQPQTELGCDEHTGNVKHGAVSLSPHGEQAELAARQATVLSCFVVCSDDALQTRVQPVMDAIVACVENCDGVVALTREGECLALFGAMAFDESHALQAVEAAMAIQAHLEREIQISEIQRAAIHLAIGIHTGKTVNKCFGDDSNTVYIGIGDTLQLAVNLKTCATPGMILASETTYELVRHVVHGEMAGLVSLQSGQSHLMTYQLIHRLSPSERVA